ncbi:uncharacterized protein LY79DRAFT_18408 [Colletotrichum navitas]|uniref:Uncharacterized protein n=1 Tax=Colletotrichum navitas TaxID=681940 RepID=A0AAD8QFE2_9PEZI|nr:uncharacterized protein LY79DRAFT_18408 [Colletotrichum navitas]KAK1600417.1 hypothetical protein LY79DRAFT_18408 [Colletotrichum navitas]
MHIRACLWRFGTFDCLRLLPGPPSAPLVFLLPSRPVPALICLPLPTVIPNLGNRCNHTGEPSVNTASDHISHKRRHRSTIETCNTKTDRRRAKQQYDGCWYKVRPKS